jgi:protein kinase D
MHCFEIRTANVDYFVGQDPLYDLQDGNNVNLPPPDSGIGAYLAKSWETSIRQALMPVTANPSEIFLCLNVCCEETKSGLFVNRT